jgi:hypothetical protein
LKFLLLFLSVLATRPLGAGDWSSLYDHSHLEAEKPRLQKALDYVLANEIQPYLPEGQRVAFGLEQIDLPLPSAVPNPLSIYSENRAIEFPLSSMLFVEDLARAYSWLWTNRYSTKTVDEYLAMLRYRNADDFPDHRYPSPLSALHIPSDALGDKKVVDLAVKTRRTAYAFLLLHEYSHIRLQSAAAKTLKTEDSEERADEYALEILKNNSAPPTGLLLVMQSWLFLEAGNPASEHPVTAKRLEAIAHYLDAHVIEFVRGRPNPSNSTDVIHSIALVLRQEAELQAVPGHNAALQEVALKTDVESLKPRPLPRSTK